MSVESNTAGRLTLSMKSGHLSGLNPGSITAATPAVYRISCGANLGLTLLEIDAEMIFQQIVDPEELTYAV